MELFSPTAPDTVGTAFLVTGVRILPRETVGNSTFFSPKLQNRFRFTVEIEWRKIDSTEAVAIGDSQSIFIPGMGEILNRVNTKFDTALAQLKFNSDITYKGQVIPAGTDIIDIIDLIGFNLKELIFPWSMIPLNLNEIIFNKADFKLEKGCYQLFASWRTTLGQTISDTVNVFLDLTDTPDPIFTGRTGKVFGDLNDPLYSLFKIDAPLKSTR